MTKSLLVYFPSSTFKNLFPSFSSPALYMIPRPCTVPESLSSFILLFRLFYFFSHLQCVLKKHIQKNILFFSEPWASQNYSKFQITWMKLLSCTFCFAKLIYFKFSQSLKLQLCPAPNLLKITKSGKFELRTSCMVEQLPIPA